MDSKGLEMVEEVKNNKSNLMSRWWSNLAPSTKTGLKVFGGLLLLSAIGVATVVSLGAAGVITAAGATGLSGTGAAFGAIGIAMGSSGTAAITTGAIVVGASALIGSTLAAGTAAVISDVSDGNPERNLRREVSKLMADNKKSTITQNLDAVKPQLLENAQKQGATMGEKRANSLVRQVESKIDNAHLSSSSKAVKKVRNGVAATAATVKSRVAKSTPSMKLPSFAKKVVNNNSNEKSMAATR